MMGEVVVMGMMVVCDDGIGCSDNSRMHSDGDHGDMSNEMVCDLNEMVCDLNDITTTTITTTSLTNQTNH